MLDTFQFRMDPLFTAIDSKSDISTESDEVECQENCRRPHSDSHLGFRQGVGTVQLSSSTDPSTSYTYVSSKAKKSLCKNFMANSYCPYGSKCQFAHGTEELRINSDSNRSYKTRLCYAFVNTGYCSYGPRCNFIHCQTHNNPQADA